MAKVTTKRAAAAPAPDLTAAPAAAPAAASGPKFTRDEVLAFLQKRNPEASAMDLSTYADAYADYRKAQDNIAEFGTIVAHPRTGAPIDNPYLRVRANALTTLRRIKSVQRVDALWD